MYTYAHSPGDFFHNILQSTKERKKLLKLRKVINDDRKHCVLNKVQASALNKDVEVQFIGSVKSLHRL